MQSGRFQDQLIDPLSGICQEFVLNRCRRLTNMIEALVDYHRSGEMCGMGMTRDDQLGFSQFGIQLRYGHEMAMLEDWARVLEKA